MKKLKIVLLFIINSYMLLGQAPVITKDNYFQIGDKFIRLRTIDSSLGTASSGSKGPNVVWNFSNIYFNNTSHFTDTITVLDPINTSFFSEPKTNYDTSNICVLFNTVDYAPWDNDYYYYRIDTSKLEFIGDWAATGNSELWFYSFSNLQTDLIFPFTYNNVSIDTFQYSYLDYAGGVWHYGKGAKRIFADAYGTLILQGNDTIFNTIRVNETRYITDSSSRGVIRTGSDTMFTWYSSNLKGPVLQFMMSWNLPSKVNVAYYYKNISPLVYVKTENVNFEKSKQFQLFQNFPNPFNPVTTIGYNVPFAANVKLELFDILGKKVVTIVNEFKEPGFYKVQLNASSLSSGITAKGGYASGVYFYTLRSGDNITVKKLTILK